MTKEQRKEARERIQREVKALSCVQQRLYTVPDLLNIKCILEDWRQWADVVACEEATNDHLWKLVKNIERIEKETNKDPRKVLDTGIMELVVDISHHPKVLDNVLKFLMMYSQFPQWTKMDWSEAQEDTLMLLANNIKKFEKAPWLVKQVLPLVEQIRTHKNASEEIKELFNTSEWATKAS